MIHFGAPVAPFRRLSVSRGHFRCGSQLEFEAALNAWAKTARTWEEKQHVVDEVIVAISARGVREDRMQHLASLAFFNPEGA